jgi:hypothetical protein
MANHVVIDLLNDRIHRAELGINRSGPLTAGCHFLAVACDAKSFREAAVPTEGIEPTLTCVNWILSPARLPIPPRRLS